MVADIGTISLNTFLGETDYYARPVNNRNRLYVSVGTTVLAAIPREALDSNAFLRIGPHYQLNRFAAADSIRFAETALSFVLRRQAYMSFRSVEGAEIGLIDPDFSVAVQNRSTRGDVAPILVPESKNFADKSLEFAWWVANIMNASVDSGRHRFSLNGQRFEIHIEPELCDLQSFPCTKRVEIDTRTLTFASDLLVASNNLSADSCIHIRNAPELIGTNNSVLIKYVGGKMTRVMAPLTYNETEVSAVFGSAYTLAGKLIEDSTKPTGEVVPFKLDGEDFVAIITAASFSEIPAFVTANLGFFRQKTGGKNYLNASNLSDALEERKGKLTENKKLRLRICISEDAGETNIFIVPRDKQTIDQVLEVINATQRAATTTVSAGSQIVSAPGAR